MVPVEFVERQGMGLTQSRMESSPPSVKRMTDRPTPRRSRRVAVSVPVLRPSAKLIARDERRAICLQRGGGLGRHSGRGTLSRGSSGKNAAGAAYVFARTEQVDRATQIDRQRCRGGRALAVPCPSPAIPGRRPEPGGGCRARICGPGYVFVRG